MNRLLVFLAALLVLPVAVSAQRSDFRHGKYGGFGGSYSPAILSGNLMLGGAGLGYGLGLEFEYEMGERGMFSLAVPLVFSKSQGEFSFGASSGEYFHYYTTFFFAPGLRIHPVGGFHKADFSLGVQLAVGSLNTREELIGGHTPNQTFSSTIVAPMGNMNLNITARDGFVFGLFWGIGPAISGKFGTHEHYGQEGDPGGALFLMGMRLGGRL
jgi:hypothetical protein